MRFLFFTLSILFSTVNIHAQDQYNDSIQNLREKHIRELLDPASQILNAQELEKIESLDYFPVDINKKIKATLVIEKGRSFQLPTSSGKTKIYRKYGYLLFNWEGQDVKLSIYQDVNLSKKPGFEEYLIIPFKDATSGKETYGGGRYLDFRMTENPSVEIDFNLAYNPYCAYSYRYNCPIPPEENHWTIAVSAGEKTPVERQ